MVSCLYCISSFICQTQESLELEQYWSFLFPCLCNLYYDKKCTSCNLRLLPLPLLWLDATRAGGSNGIRELALVRRTSLEVKRNKSQWKSSKQSIRGNLGTIPSVSNYSLGRGTFFFYHFWYYFPGETVAHLMTLRFIHSCISKTFHLSCTLTTSDL